MSIQRAQRKLREARKLMSLVVTPELRPDAERLIRDTRQLEDRSAALLRERIGGRTGL